MLKPADPRSGAAEPIGELVHELVDDAKAYAQAEVGSPKQSPAPRRKALILPADCLAISSWRAAGLPRSR